MRLLTRKYLKHKNIHSRLIEEKDEGIINIMIPNSERKSVAMQQKTVI